MEKQLSGIQIGKQLQTNRLFKLAEIVLVFIPALALIRLMNPYVEDHPVLKQTVVWATNILMLFIIWLGLKLRGERWKNFGPLENDLVKWNSWSSDQIEIFGGILKQIGKKI